jgi:hypothetical protein
VILISEHCSPRCWSGNLLVDTAASVCRGALEIWFQPGNFYGILCDICMHDVHLHGLIILLLSLFVNKLFGSEFCLGSKQYLVQRIVSLLCKSYFRVHKSPPLEPVGVQMNSIHILTPCTVKRHCCATLLSTPRWSN